VSCGICAIESVRGENADPALVTAFLDWFQTHRGAKPPTLRLYARGAAELLQALGDDVSQWTAHAVRNFLLCRARQCGSPTTQKLITSLRAFLRYLNFRGESRDDLALAIPAVAHWRLAKLPRCLSSEEVNRLIAACDGSDPGRLRDRAIVLLLVRLGLRAGDVVQLRLKDIDWNRGTLQVIGKGRYQVRLPLPQDVGDAMLGYWNDGLRLAIPTVCLFEASPLISSIVMPGLWFKGLGRALLTSSENQPCSHTQTVLTS
jgi:site-specific recombinase XerD